MPNGASGGASATARRTPAGPASAGRAQLTRTRFPSTLAIDADRAENSRAAPASTTDRARSVKHRPSAARNRTAHWTHRSSSTVFFLEGKTFSFWGRVVVVPIAAATSTPDAAASSTARQAENWTSGPLAPARAKTRGHL